jgi:hypothetical protein
MERWHTTAGVTALGLMLGRERCQHERLEWYASAWANLVNGR